MKHSSLQRMIALGVITLMAEGTDAATAGSNAAGTEVAVQPDHSFKHSFYFRSMLDTAKNRETISSLGEIEESETDEEQSDGTIKKIPTVRRKTETYTFQLPVVDTGNEKLNVVLLDIIKNEIIAAAKPFVNRGEVPPADKLTWEALIESKYIAITTAGSADSEGSGFNSALLKEVAEKFTKFMTALGKDANGISIMAKMITGRFSVMATHKYINGLPMVAGNIEKWLLEGCDEEEQNTYSDVTDYLLKRLEEAKNPPKVDTGSLF